MGSALSDPWLLTRQPFHTSTRQQVLALGFGHWNFEFGINLEFGAWDLEFESSYCLFSSREP
jgi:hypothetical protein